MQNWQYLPVSSVSTRVNKKSFKETISSYHKCTLEKLKMKLTVFCSFLDPRFILWDVRAETHEVKPWQMSRHKKKLENLEICSCVNVFLNTWAFCGFQGNGTQRSFTTPTHHAGIIPFMLRVTGIESLQEERDQNMIIRIRDHKRSRDMAAVWPSVKLYNWFIEKWKAKCFF